MSIDISRITYPIEDNLKIKIEVPVNHFLVRLSSVIPWMEFADLAIADLYKDRKKSGKKLNLRLHIGAYVLQSLLGWTDRELEENLNFYAPARSFCAMESMKSYDHSAYVKFRNRISLETANRFSQNIVKVAHRKGFTNSSQFDLDSTVQEANIEYPADIRLMQKIVLKGKKILDTLIDKGSRAAIQIKSKINFRKILKKCRGYYFAKKSEKGMELKKKIFRYMEKETSKLVRLIQSLVKIVEKSKLKWNRKNDFNQINDIAPQLLKQIRYFIKKGTVAENKILSLHSKEVKCMSKGKAGKAYEFGRKFFVGRLPGNYALGFTSEDFALEDAYSMDLALNNFEEIYGESPKSITGDQAFWSRSNLKTCDNHKISEIGICPRGHKNWKVSPEKAEELKNRRAGVEPIIGHLKRRGMGKSKMKSDNGTKLSGQRAVLSLNCAKIIRDLNNEELNMVS
jgi:transposase, IS5 family